MTLEERIRVLEERLQNTEGSLVGLVQNEFKKSFRTDVQNLQQFGLYKALCVQTIDPLKTNAVQFFHPLWADPDTTVDQLPFAKAISFMGGFDDCGLNWVPPAGSTLLLICEGGDRDAVYYLGTLWNRDRGPDGALCEGRPHNFNYPIKEYQNIWEGHRKGFLVGPNDGSQVYPPWNTENYNNFDSNTKSDFYENSESQKRVTQPHIYGFKSPEKHMLKLVDGNPKCERRYKRLELMSGTGNWLMMKDDHLRPCGEWSHTTNGVSPPPRFAVRCGKVEEVAQGEPITCGSAGPDKSECSDQERYDDAPSPISILGDCKARSADEINDNLNVGTNPFYKSANECRPYRGTGTPLNAKCALPQSGIQFMTLSGHTWVGDDSVDEPEGCPRWERSLESFSFGKSNIFRGKTFWKSATGHLIELNDREKIEELRSDENRIRALTGNGHLFEMNDHTIKGENGDCIAGSKRRILLRSTANHSIELRDTTTPQCGPTRRDGGQPVAKAKSKNCYIKLQTGYGIRVLMSDDNSQEETVKQYYQVFCPQDSCCGPHIMHFQTSPSCGFVFLRAAGNYFRSTAGDDVVAVGNPDGSCLGPRNKLTYVTNDYFEITKGTYLNTNKKFAVLSESTALIGAGKDCPGADDETEAGPCFLPVACWRSDGLVISDRVFVSASPDACALNPMMGWIGENCNPQQAEDAMSITPTAVDAPTGDAPDPPVVDTQIGS